MTARVSMIGEAERGATEQQSFGQLVHLFRTDIGTATTQEDWAATIELVQGVAQRIRTLHRDAHAMAQDADEIVSSARADVLSAEARAREAEVEADAARRRADQAERQVQALTRNLAEAEQRIEKAEQRTAEVSVWLRRIHDSMTDEFNNLTVNPLPPKRT